MTFCKWIKKDEKGMEQLVKLLILEESRIPGLKVNLDKTKLVIIDRSQLSHMDVKL